jgi:hypothetical protein
MKRENLVTLIGVNGKRQLQFVDDGDAPSFLNPWPLLRAVMECEAIYYTVDMKPLIEGER